MPDKIKLYRLSSSRYRFDLIANNRAVIGSSEEYPSKQEASEAIDFLKESVEDESLYRVFTGSNGKSYFEIETEEGELVLCSQAYSSLASATEGMRAAREVTAAAIIVEVG